MKFMPVEAVKVQRRSRGTLLLISALDEGGCSTPSSGLCTPQERNWVPIIMQAWRDKGPSGRVQKILDPTVNFVIGLYRVQ
jgi:hypothetical protein